MALWRLRMWCSEKPRHVAPPAVHPVFVSRVGVRFQLGNRRRRALLRDRALRIAEKKQLIAGMSVDDRRLIPVEPEAVRLIRDLDSGQIGKLLADPHSAVDLACF